MKNIFEDLQSKGICYAVGVALNTFRSIAQETNSREFFIIAAETDTEKLRDLDFKKSDRKKQDLIERELNQEEIRIFKTMPETFTKVKHNRHGRIYELRKNSFKEYFQANEQTINNKS